MKQKFFYGENIFSRWFFIIFVPLSREHRKVFWVARNDSSNSKRLVLAGSRIILQSRIIPKSTIPCGEYRVTHNKLSLFSYTVYSNAQGKTDKNCYLCTHYRTANDLRKQLKQHMKLLRCLIGFGQPRRDSEGVFALI